MDVWVVEQAQSETTRPAKPRVSANPAVDLSFLAGLPV